MYIIKEIFLVIKKRGLEMYRRRQYVLQIDNAANIRYNTMRTYKILVNIVLYRTYMQN
jgi:hypothetical protein